MAMTLRAKTFEAWMRANFSRGDLRDIAGHGADAGWHGLTYYTDTVKLYDRYEDDIWDALVEDADSMGSSSPFELIAGFGGAKDVGSAHQAKNLLVWYLAERIAREITDQ